MDCSQDGSGSGSARRRNDRYIHSVRLCNSRRCFPYFWAQVHSRIRRTSRRCGDYTRFRRDFDTYAFPSFPILFCVHFILCTPPKIVPLFSCKQKKREECILSLMFYASRFSSVVSSGFLSRISMNSSPVMVSFSNR